LVGVKQSKVNITLEIRDPIHGSIHISPCEVPVIEHPFFQRLRKIKQLGFSDSIFPGATHTRFIHSIGVMHTVGNVFDKLFNANQSLDHKRLKQTVRLAGLLHDIGHAPLSHSTESVMPKISELQIPKRLVDEDETKQATHEHYTIKAIADSFFTESLNLAKESLGIDEFSIAELVTGKTNNPDYFTINDINYFPLLHQLVSSEIDCDRMDYLLRDSYFCGVSYGKFDLDWLIDNFQIAIESNTAFLGISERALTSFDDFLISRYHMFLMVYFHYRAVCLEQMLYRYFQHPENEYEIPASIEQYLQHDDHYLQEILKKSGNFWSKKITKNHIPDKIFERFGVNDIEQEKKIESILSNENIDFIKCESKGRLSKYSGKNSYYPIKVVKQYNKSIIDIFKATDLFSRYSTNHSVTRIHCYKSNLSNLALNKINEILKS